MEHTWVFSHRLQNVIILFIVTFFEYLLKANSLSDEIYKSRWKYSIVGVAFVLIFFLWEKVLLYTGVNRELLHDFCQDWPQYHRRTERSSFFPKQ